MVYPNNLESNPRAGKQAKVDLICIIKRLRTTRKSSVLCVDEWRGCNALQLTRHWHRQVGIKVDKMPARLQSWWLVLVATHCITRKLHHLQPRPVITPLKLDVCWQIVSKFSQFSKIYYNFTCGKFRWRSLLHFILIYVRFLNI